MSKLGKKRIQSLGATATVAIAAQLWAASAFALTTLKQVQVSNGSQIDLLFDGKISKGQLKTEYFNDIIQISMTDVAVYPAKISSINGGDLTKVFAYQYAPKLVRCRITVRGKAEDYKDRFKVVTTSPGGKVITLALESGKHPAGIADSISAQTAAPARSAVAEKPSMQAEGAPKVAEKAAEKANDAEEKALLERVMSSGAPVTAAETKGASSEKRVEKDSGKESSNSDKSEKKEDSKKVKAQSQTLGGAKPLPSFTGLFVKLGAVLAAFGLLAFAVRKLMNLRQQGAIEAAVTGEKSASGVAGALGRFARNGLGRLGGIGGKPRLIEVLSTQHLGPKNSIAVVRVMEQVLVLGISADAISLITQIGEGESGLGLESLEDLEELGVLSKHSVKGRASKTSAAASLAAAQVAPQSAAKPAANQMASPASPDPRSLRGAGAVSAGPAVFADLLRNETSKPKATHPLSPASREYLVAGGATGPSAQSMSGAAPQGPAYSANFNSNIRAQIKSRIEGMKQL